MEKKPTIRDVASTAGVSASTVSRVLNSSSNIHMKAETRERVLAAIRHLNYTPTRSAQRMRRQRRDIIGILLPDISNPYFSLLARGAESIAFENGYSTLICDSNHSEERESRYLDLLIAEQVDGIVFIPVGVPDWPRLRRLLDHGTRIVAADRCLDGILGVEAANWQGSHDLTQHVIELGHRSIAYVAGPADVQTTQDRLRGFMDAMAEAHLEPVAMPFGNYTFDSGMQLSSAILDDGPVDVIMGGDDLVALGAIRAAEARGLRVPEDLGVTGFDSVPLLSLIHPTLTSVRIPVFDIGREAMSMLVRHMGSSDSVEQRKVLDVEIIPGSSCCARVLSDHDLKSPLYEKQKHEGVVEEKHP